MRPPTRGTVEKAAFVLSVALLTFVVGYLARDYRWFPHSFLQRALEQGRAQLRARARPPDFTSPVGRREVGEADRRGEVEPGLTLVTSTWEDFGWKPGLKLIDRDGRVHHEWRVNPTELFSESDHRRGTNLAEQDIHGTHLLPNGDVVVNVEYAGAVRLDACGRVRWKIGKGAHHSVARAEDGSFWIPGVTGARPPRSERYPDGYPGLDGAIHHSLIVHVSEDGEVLRTFRVLDLLYDNGLERFIPKNRQHDRRDVVHLNDVEPLSSARAEEFPLFRAGDLLVSLRNLDLVFVFDPESRRVKWSASRPFILQHDPDYLRDGWIGVFDNNWDDTERGTMLGGSRIVALQPHADSAKVLFPTSRSEPFYTAHRGKWQQLPGGNRLLAESDEGRVVEVAPDGRTVWEWAAEPYDGSRVPSVPRAERVRVTPDAVAEWPCSPGETTAGDR